jgi:hypothetical protein
MIEAATGAVFLMTSLYGAGHANAQTIVSPATTMSTTAGSAITRTVANDPKAVEAYLRDQFADTPILVEVARCESTFRQYDSSGQVIRGIVNKGDVGVMQINEMYHADEAAKLGYDIYSIDGNVAMAKRLYAKFGTSPWSSSKPCWGASAIAKK